MVPGASNSKHNGFKIIFDVEAYDYVKSSSGSEGIYLSMLHQLDIPIMKNTAINLAPGNVNKIELIW